MTSSTLQTLNPHISCQLKIGLDSILKKICLEKNYLQYLDQLKANFPDAEEALLEELTAGISDSIIYCHNFQSALGTWNVMKREDRMAIIKTFYAIFNQPLKSFSTEQRTIIFCKVFLNEFVPFLGQPSSSLLGYS